jgi:DnaJ-class molecular chaperone
MYDLSVPNARPGKCEKCSGRGIYCFGGAVVNGVFQGQSGPCHSCNGTGRQTAADIRRNIAYNRYKIARIARDMAGS